MMRVWWVVLMHCAGVIAVESQEPAVLREVLDSGPDWLYGITAAAANGERLGVLTTEFPAVHVLGSEPVVEWGERGQGPGELSAPSDIAWPDAHIGILDTGNRRIELFDAGGGHVRSRGLGGVWANRMDIVAGDTIIGTFVPMSDDRRVVRLRGEEVDTLFEYVRRGDSVRLTAQGAPSLTVKSPFTGQDEWTVLPDGGFAWYLAESQELRFGDREGGFGEAIRLDWVGAAVGSAEKEWWIAAAIPSDFQGRPVFEPLRDVARREVEFPEKLPAVLGLEADATDGVWVKRSLATRGEVWGLVRSDGEVDGEVRLPVGRELLAVGAAGLFVLGRDEFDLEFIEVYARPDWAR